MDRRSFLVIAAGGAGLAFARSGSSALANARVARVTAIVRADRQWMKPATYGCAGTRRPLRFAGADRAAMLRLT